MKRLAVLRHAKSSWAQPGTSDEARPLNQRGFEQLGQLSKWIAAKNFKPDLIICSPSVRTRQTHQAIEGALGDCKIEFDPALYNGALENYLNALWGLSDAENVLLIGHNPNCDELVRYLTMPSSPAADSLMSNHFATASLAMMELEGDNWSDLGQSTCLLNLFLRPKDLEQGISL